MTSDVLRVHVHEHVATLTLNRPEKRNAVTFDMWSEIAETVTQLSVMPEAKVLVITGEGTHFCAGADISGLTEGNGGRYGDANRAAEEAIAAFPGPVVAMIRGSCVGGGVQIINACDIRIADTTSQFGITPSKLGIIYPTYALRRAVEVIGPTATKHLLFSGEIIDATRALRIGLIDELLDPEQLEQRVRELVHVMATQRSHLTQVATKEMVKEILGTGDVSYELAQRWSQEVENSGEDKEGVSAFLEKRSPRFPFVRRH
jgi:enoyl-CoA hydratase/carnithine racemase